MKCSVITKRGILSKKKKKKKKKDPTYFQQLFCKLKTGLKGFWNKGNVALFFNNKIKSPTIYFFKSWTWNMFYFVRGLIRSWAEIILLYVQGTDIILISWCTIILIIYSIKYSCHLIHVWKFLLHLGAPLYHGVKFTGVHKTVPLSHVIFLVLTNLLFLKGRHAEGQNAISN